MTTENGLIITPVTGGETRSYVTNPNEWMGNVLAETDPVTGGVEGLQAGIDFLRSNVASTLIPGGAAPITNAIVPIYLHSHDGPPTTGHIWNAGPLDQIKLSDMAGNELAYWISAMGEYDIIPTPSLKAQPIIDYRGVIFATDGTGTGSTGSTYRSNDNGITWATLNSGTYYFSDSTGLLWACAYSGNRSASGEPYLFAFETNNSTVYRLSRSIDGGVTWASVQDLHSIDFGHGAGAASRSVLPMGFCEDPVNGNLYAGLYQTTPNEAVVMKSTDHGATWAVVFNSRSTVVGSDFPDATTQHVHGLYCAAAGDTVYVGTDAANNKRVIKTTDGGTTWTVIAGPGVPWDLTRAVEFGGKRYFGTGAGALLIGAGLYETSDDSTFTSAFAGSMPANNVTADTDTLWAYLLSYGKSRYPQIMRSIDGINFKQVWIAPQDIETTAQFDGWAYARNSGKPGEQQRQTLVGLGYGENSYPPLRLISNQGRSMALAWVRIPVLPTSGLRVKVTLSAPVLAVPTAAELFSGDVLATAGDGLVARFLLTDNVADGGAVVDSIAGNNGVFDTYNAGSETTWDATDGAPTSLFYPPVPRITPCLYNKEGVEDSGGVRFGTVAAFDALTANPTSDPDGFAVAAWVKIPSSGVTPPGAMAMAIAKGYGTTSLMWAFGFSTAGNLAFAVQGTVATVASSSNSSVGGSFRDGLWHLVGVNVISSLGGTTEFQFAIDGVLLNQATPQTVAATIPAPHTAGKNLGIGSAWNSTTPQGGLQGKIQDARIYSRTLTAAEWKELYEHRPAATF